MRDQFFRQGAGSTGYVGVGEDDGQEAQVLVQNCSEILREMPPPSVVRMWRVDELYAGLVALGTPVLHFPVELGPAGWFG